MEVKTYTSGVEKLAARLEGMGDALNEKLLEIARQQAEVMQSTAQGLTYLNIQKVTGETAQSIDSYLEQRDGELCFGTSTRNMRTMYHELGTGPVGTAAGYPGEEGLNEPIVRRSTPWIFWSDSIPNKDGSGTHSGFVQSEGVSPQAFMHNATMAVLPDVEKDIQQAIREVMSGK